MNSVTQRGLTFVGLDVHKDSISAAILRPRLEVPDVEKISSDDESVRRFISRFKQPKQLRVCYEAGPTGFGVARLLTAMNVSCEVVAPSLIPKAAGDRVKTDRRDARRLARLYRAGELVPIRVPTLSEEAVRDLCRARADVVDDRKRARQRLGALLLRHGQIYRAGAAWTNLYEQWQAALRFDESALQATFDHYRAVLADRDAALAAVEADLMQWLDREPFADAVHRLAAYRGVAELGALTLASEVADWRRFPRAATFMGFTGLVPSEYSSGGSTRRGHITKTGNEHLRTQLVESAWSYQHRASVGVVLRKRQDRVPAETIARSWACQQRLCGRFRRLAARKNLKTVVVTAIARELAGFLWAEMTAT
jgi:transposase